MDTLEKIVKHERIRVHAFVDAKQEFLYLKLLNENYFNGVFNMCKIYEFALDAYNYWEKNKVLYSKDEALITTLKMMYEVYNKEVVGDKK